jgi:MoaA/NifB/PqqE/SkfB family radical SAM enzyme
MHAVAFAWRLLMGACTVKTIHFCGGEPTIHRQLPELIEHVHAQHRKSKLTTNGLTLPDQLLRVLYTAKTQVKVSLHGPQAHHNEVVGCDAFDKTVSTIRRLIAAHVSTSVQTTIVAGQLAVVDWMVQFCIDNGVKRLSFLPFIPRGSGLGQRSTYELSGTERHQLHELVKQKRRALNNRIDIRLLDFNTRPIHVVEPDGRIVLEKATEAMDAFLYQIPQAQTVL